MTVVALAATGCSGGDSSPDNGAEGDTAALQARLKTAQQIITDAEALDISLTTERLPQGVTGLLSATGTGYQGQTVAEAAFTGAVNVVAGGSTLKAEVIAVDGVVYAKTGLTPTFLTIDPATLQAPDPASLLGAKGDGLPVILVNTDSLKDQGKSRDGKTVLTTISGTIGGAVISQFLPSADEAGTFAVTYRLTDDDQLADAAITGPFYPGGDKITYTVKLDPAASKPEITQP